MAMRVKSVGWSGGKAALSGHTGSIGEEAAATAASKRSVSESECGIPKRRESAASKRPCSDGASTISASSHPKPRASSHSFCRRQRRSPAHRQRQGQKEKIPVVKRGRATAATDG